MKLNEFLTELAKTRDGWYNRGGGLRKNLKLGGNHCPITAVCVRVKKIKFLTGDYALAGRRLGLSPDLVESIADGADSEKRQYSWMRSRLLKAVGLK